MVEKENLPEGWVETTLNDIAILRNEKVEPSTIESIPYISLGHIESGTNRIINHGLSAEVKSLKSIFRSGDVLYGRLRPNLNKVCQPDFDGVCSTDILVFRSSQAIDSRFLMRLLSRKETVEFASMHSKGINLPRISFQKLGELPVNLPPFNEQKRIVSKIEKLQTRSRRAMKALETTPELIEKLRQSILSAAFRGDLTRKWRQQNTNVEPAIELLKRIRIERRKRWEAAELEKLKAKGLTDDKLEAQFVKRCKQYKKPSPVDTTGLPQLPEGWAWGSIEEISGWVTDGTHQPPPFTEDGIPFLVISNMMSGEIRWDSVQKWVSLETYNKYTGSYKPSRGDVIYSTVGSYGVAVEIVSDSKFMFQRHIGHIRPISDLLLPKYLTFLLNSPLCKKQADKSARGVAQKTINLSDLRRFVIPIVPLSEQRKLVESISKLLVKAENQRNSMRSLLIGVENFDQSVLSKAFNGDLVPQDPKDESASILLERIRQENARHTADQKSKISKRGKKMKTPKSAQKDILTILQESARAMTPEELFSAAGFGEDSVDAFYEQLRSVVSAKKIRETRKGDVVRLEAAR